MKNTLIGGGVNSDPNFLSGKRQSNHIGEGNYDDEGSYGNGALIETLWDIVAGRTGIVSTMLAMLCGLVYLLLVQRQKIYEFEQKITGGEFRVLAWLP